MYHELVLFLCTATISFGLVTVARKLSLKTSKPQNNNTMQFKSRILHYTLCNGIEHTIYKQVKNKYTEKHMVLRFELTEKTWSVFLTMLTLSRLTRPTVRKFCGA